VSGSHENKDEAPKRGRKFYELMINDEIVVNKSGRWSGGMSTDNASVVEKTESIDLIKVPKTDRLRFADCATFCRHSVYLWCHPAHWCVDKET